MILNNHLLLPEPYSTRLVSTPAHPQLRDLLVYAPEAPGSVSVVCYDSIARHALDGQAPPSYTRLKFSPSTLAAGCGLIAVGGQSSELALKAAQPGSTWCYQQPSQPNGSINNSIHIAPAPMSASRVGGGSGIRLYVSSNAERIEVYDVAGPVPDYERARRRRQKRPSERMELDDSEKGEDDEDSVEEDGVYDQGGTCTLERVEMDNLDFDTAINHSSISPDGRWLVCVGDTNEVHLLQAQSDGSFLPYHRFEASKDASFSTDWSSTGDKFAVASQDGYVNVYDIRSLPPATSDRSADPSTPPPRTVATLKATQGGPAGAVRKLKFSPGSRVDSELLAFTEHRSKVHVVDARHFNEMQLLDIPSCSSSSATSPPPRPRPPPAHSLRPHNANPNPRAFVDSLYPPSSERVDRSSPEERFMRRLLQDVGNTTEERSRSRGSRGWRYMSGADGEAVAVATDDGDEEEEEDEEDEMEDDDELAVLEQGLSAQRTRLITDDDCPPDANSSPSSSASLSLPNANYARILPDPRARPRSSTARRTVPNPVLTNLVSDLPPFHFSPTGSSPTRHDSPRPPRAQVLSGYSPLSTSASSSARHPDPNSGAYLDGSIVSSVNYLDTIGLSALGAGGYQPNSLYFPVESTPSDLLGLDWDEEGRSLFVATEGRVWEWEVDVRGRRSFGDWGMR
ncbi:hypothetical protein BCR35DRAFT_300826 [Leucosporidium creatinivorum]|uniref:DUF2415 domain-containing protein n=1 Tax=Leucosporidium creatinivorum TaxID=106004 RepID=A0A1Y2FY93_9BASI|nr:hypothetical protein BCR35DRAFT_300826 [Leucosporidium creatinivorum]